MKTFGFKFDLFGDKNIYQAVIILTHLNIVSLCKKTI